MIDLEHKLNPQQCLTARETEGAFLVIAGAGSGKTRTITYRIANMLDKGIPQSAILALTFTNKAAREMADRVKELVGRKLPMLTVSTFHAFGVRVLRESISHLGYKENFSIYDQADKMALIKETARSLKIDPAELNLYDLANLFSDIKTGRARWDADSSQYSPIYDEYNELLKLYNAVDFDDLIVLPIKLFKEKPDVLEKYRKRYRYIMVDEFQDTSKIQYDLVYLLAKESRNICVVGDDDQSIYSWRGANYENIVQFEKDFPEVKEIKLEQNYRSTGTILDAANSIISHNTKRKKKNLWSKSGEGNPIELSYPDNEIKEAQFIAETITLLRMQDDLSYGDFGILVRTNSLTTAIEDALLMNGIPYAVSGGQSFFQRKEIKDIIAYLRVITNPDDDISLLRIINTPRRGIGKKALEQITELGKKEKCSVFAAMQKLDKYEDFVNMITAYKGKFLSGKNLAATLNALVDEIHYWDHLITEYQKNEKEAKWKYKNILTFISLLDRWEQENEEEESIYSYLNKITLITRDDDQDTEGGKVGLMTIHAAKGLEFKVVFLAGCEDAIIPHARALEEDPANIEEERRLFYVAVTRAMDKLYITSCRMRHHLRDCVTCIPSRFLEEIPAELIQNGEEEKEETPEEATKRMLEQFEKLRARWK
ncbi:MAG: UvrD-helicase domain-containing protein [Spirochaetia bacterium]|nr:UvrD-helicase domain-containing protein [Spirochaetia bacterium]MBR5927857.1 UvrD-helicase domain-containing protein [Spirochaetia bacterium]